MLAKNNLKPGKEKHFHSAGKHCILKTKFAERLEEISNFSWIPFHYVYLPIASSIGNAEEESWEVENLHLISLFSIDGLVTVAICFHVFVSVYYSKHSD